jgi:hypothetical protein
LIVNNNLRALVNVCLSQFLICNILEFIVLESRIPFVLVNDALGLAGLGLFMTFLFG